MWSATPVAITLREVFRIQKTKRLVILALIVALGVVLSRYLSIQTPMLRIGFAFVAYAAAGILYGPIYAGVVGGMVDILGFVLFPTGAYFPGITLSAVLHGVIYGILMYKHQPSIPRVLISSALSAFAIGGLLTTYWLTILMPGHTFTALLLTRSISTIVLFPVQVTLILALWKAFEKAKITNLVQQ